MQVELAANAPTHHCTHRALVGESCRWCALRQRERKLFAAMNVADDVLGLIEGAGLRGQSFLQNETYPFVQWANADTVVTFHFIRGFIGKLVLPWSVWYDHYFIFGAAAPIQEVRVPSMPDGWDYLYRDDPEQTLKDIRKSLANYWPHIKFTWPVGVDIESGIGSGMSWIETDDF